MGFYHFNVCQFHIKNVRTLKKLCTFKLFKNKKNIYLFFPDILFCLAILPLFFTLEFDFPLPPNVLSFVFPFMPLFLPPNPYLASLPFLLCCDLKNIHKCVTQFII